MTPLPTKMQLAPLLLAPLMVLPCRQDTTEEPAPAQDHESTPMSAPQDGEPEHPANRLADETSPYLLQHAHNPVEWYPWGPEALEKAKAENKPIFLSIGYSACHWCHVMEHESFENPRIARIMNEHFVCVKVDREERPDIDEIYMKFVQQTTGSGGWPMSVFLTPDRQPFYGGTYFPPTRQWGRPGFDDLLTMMAQGWENDRDNILKHAGRFREALAKEASADTSSALADNIVQRSAVALLQNHDTTWGGFGSAPKFPHSMDLRVLLRHWQSSGDETALAAVRLTLDRMSQGGAYDQLGGGFHRYSVDEKWLIPHFEKMLYDNALLVPVYLELYQVTGDERYARVARECCDWVLREMVTVEGGFASTQDADSEGEEGKFFAWTPDELYQHLGREAGEIACTYWGVTDEGNFEHGKSALWREFPDEHVASLLDMEVGPMLESIEASRAKLFEIRAGRIAPGTDDKVLASWNGMMISALARTWQVLGDDRYLDAARGAAKYVLEGMRQEDGRLFATARNGRAHLNAYLDDYAFMIGGLLDLYESDFDPAWLRHALELEDVVDERFLDKERGGYYTTGSNHEELLARIKSPHDGALPSGNSVQALNLLRLAELCGKPEFAKGAERTMLSVGRMVNNYPAAFSQLVLAADFIGAKPREVVIAGELDSAAVQAMLAAVRAEYLPQKVVALADSRADRDLIPLLREREPGEGGARAYICRNYTCKLPVESLEAMLEQLRED